MRPLGGSSEAAPPVPIPNTEVKRPSADDTASARVWENRSLPGGFSFHQRSGLAGTRPTVDLRPHVMEFYYALGCPEDMYGTHKRRE